MKIDVVVWGPRIINLAVDERCREWDPSKNPEHRGYQNEVEDNVGLL